MQVKQKTLNSELMPLHNISIFISSLVFTSLLATNHVRACILVGTLDIQMKFENDKVIGGLL